MKPNPLKNDKTISRDEIVSVAQNAERVEKMTKLPADVYKESEHWFVTTQYKSVMDCTTTMTQRLSTAFCIGLVCGWYARRDFVKELKRKRG
jgi:hypothetical protein